MRLAVHMEIDKKDLGKLAAHIPKKTGKKNGVGVNIFAMNDRSISPLTAWLWKTKEEVHLQILENKVASMDIMLGEKIRGGEEECQD